MPILTFRLNEHEIARLQARETKMIVYDHVLEAAKFHKSIDLSIVQDYATKAKKAEDEYWSLVAQFINAEIRRHEVTGFIHEPDINLHTGMIVVNIGDPIEYASGEFEEDEEDPGF